MALENICRCTSGVRRGQNSSLSRKLCKKRGFKGVMAQSNNQIYRNTKTNNSMEEKCPENIFS